MLEQVFYERVKDELQKRFDEMGIVGTVHLETIVKPNDIILTGISFFQGDKGVAPMIYLNHCYEKFGRGASFADIIDELYSVLLKKPRAVVESLPTEEYESVRDKVNIRVCGYDRNQKWLENKVYERRGDFAYTYHLSVEVNDSITGTITIDTSHLENWKISEETLKRDAIENMKKEEVVLMEMKEVIFGLLGLWEAENLYDMDCERWPEDDDPVLYVLTNKNRRYGASLMVRPDVLEHATNILGGDYYVLPSSVHETILIPEKNSPSLDALLKMVYTINRSEVEPKNVLSDQVQYYDHKHKMLMNAQEYFARKQERENGSEERKVLNRQRDVAVR